MARFAAGEKLTKSLFLQFGRKGGLTKALFAIFYLNNLRVNLQTNSNDARTSYVEFWSRVNFGLSSVLKEEEVILCGLVKTPKHFTFVHVERTCSVKNSVARRRMT